MRANPGRCLILGAAVLLALPVHSDDALSTSGAPDDPGMEASAAVPLVKARIEQIEESAGPFSPALGEPLGEFGLLLLQQGSHVDARMTFRRAMQVERVNGGLYSPRQIPFLDLAIESSIAARDWKQVDEDFSYYEWLKYRIHGHQDPALIDALGRIINWHLAAVHLDVEGKKGNHLLQLLELGEKRIAITEQYLGGSHPRLQQQLYLLALYHYYVAIAVQRDGPISDVLLTTLASPIDLRRSPFLAREGLIEDCYRRGRRLLQRAIDAARTGPVFTREAEAIGRLYLADWELMFNHDDRAEKLYGEAFGMLASAGIAVEAVRNFFAAPALLPEQSFRLAMVSGDSSGAGRGAEFSTTPATIRFVAWTRELPGIHFPADTILAAPAAAGDRHALARFQVEKNGWVENVRIVEVRPEDRSLSREARNAIWYAQFRPRLEDGRVAVTRDVEARFIPTE